MGGGISKTDADKAYIDQAELDAYLNDYATQKYLQDYYTKTAADAAVTNALQAYQPAGEYVTTSALNSMKYASKDDLSNFASFKDVEESSTKLQDYLVKDYLPKTYQPKGNYALKTDIPSLSGYALKTDIPSLSGYALKTDIPSLTNYLGKQDAVNLYQPKGNYALKTDIPSLSGYAKTSDLSGFVKADTTSLTNYLGKKAAESLYQPKGNYQPAGNYLSADALNSGLTMNQWGITPSSEKLCFTKGNKVLGCIDSRGLYEAEDKCVLYSDNDNNISKSCVNQIYNNAGCTVEQNSDYWISLSNFKKDANMISKLPSMRAKCYGQDESKWPPVDPNLNPCEFYTDENQYTYINADCINKLLKQEGCPNPNNVDGFHDSLADFKENNLKYYPYEPQLRRDCYGPDKSKWPIYPHVSYVTGRYVSIGFPNDVTGVIHLFEMEVLDNRGVVVSYGKPVIGKNIAPDFPGSNLTNFIGGQYINYAETEPSNDEWSYPDSELAHTLGTEPGEFLEIDLGKNYDISLISVENRYGYEYRDKLLGAVLIISNKPNREEPVYTSNPISNIPWWNNSPAFNPPNKEQTTDYYDIFVDPSTTAHRVR